MSPAAKKPTPRSCPSCGLNLYFDWVETALVDTQTHVPAKVLALICPKLKDSDIKVVMTLPGSHKTAAHFLRLVSELKAEGYHIPRGISIQPRIR